MGSKLYVGNLSYNVDSSALEQLFSQHGTVQSAEVIADRDTGRSKGFGFVQMGSDEEAQAAISAALASVCSKGSRATPPVPSMRVPGTLAAASWAACLLPCTSA